MVPGLPLPAVAVPCKGCALREPHARCPHTGAPLRWSPPAGLRPVPPPAQRAVGGMSITMKGTTTTPGAGRRHHKSGPVPLSSYLVSIHPRGCPPSCFHSIQVFTPFHLPGLLFQ